MAEIIPYTASDLITTITTMDKTRTNLFLSLFFRQEVTSPARDIALDLIDSSDVPMAAFCSPMVGSRVMREKGYETKSFTPGYLKPKKEIDVTKLVPRWPGEVMSDMSGNRDALIVKALDEQQGAIDARKEWLAVQAITTGKNVISGDGIETYEIDWKMSAANRITQTNGTAWSNQDKETYDPNDDLENYAEAAQAPINVIIFGKKAWQLYRSFKSVKQSLDTRRGSNSRLETTLQNLGEFVSHKGYVGDVAIIVYTGKYKNEDGTEEYYLDPMTIVMGNTSHKGLVAYGAIQDPAAAREGLNEASLYPKNYVVPGDPEIEYVQTQSAPQPIPAGIDKFVTVFVK